jgi:hypothetical protein
MKRRAADQEGADLSNELYKLIMRAQATDVNVDHYIVVDSNGHRSIETRAELLKANPSTIFDGGRIVLGNKTFDTETSKVAMTQRYYVKGSDYYTSQVEGSEPIDLEINNLTSELSNTVYDADTISTVVAAIDKTKFDRSYTAQKLEANYASYVDQLVDNLLIIEAKLDSIEDAQEIRRNVLSKSRAEQSAVFSIRANIKEKLGSRPSIVSMIQLLEKGEAGFLELFDELKTDSTKKIFRKPPKELYIEKGKIPIVAAEQVMIDAQNNITQLGVGEFKALLGILGVDSSVFGKYVRTVFLPETGAGGLRMLSGELYIPQGDKISASKQLSVLNDKSEKNKPIKLPSSMRYQYTKPASKEVLLSMTRFLNKRLPGVKWVMMTSKEIETRFGKKYFNDKGLFKSNGQVIINTDKAGIETPFHEFGHVYLQYLLQDNPAEYAALMAQTKAHDLFKVMKQVYPGISSTDVAEEVFCELLSMSATDKLTLDKNEKTLEIVTGMSNMNGPFGKIINTFTNWIKSFFGIKTGVELSMNDSLGSIIDDLSDEVLFGKESMLSKFSEEAKYNISKSRSASTLTIKEAREVLVSRGYIEMFCSK